LNTTWKSLVRKYSLNESQEAQFRLYADLLISWNQKFNLTAITDEAEIVSYHFDDSLKLSQLVDLNTLESIADVGAGAGFPGVPLKIMYPHLKLVLIEVNGKKVEFLNHVTQELGLDQIEVVQLDWRAFIREGQYQVDLFCARASLQVEELVRIFKPGCVYKNAKLVYWAAQNWQADPKFRNLIADKFSYTVGSRNRNLVLFKQGE